jgi:hypothetical protein
MGFNEYSAEEAKTVAREFVDAIAALRAYHQREQVEDRLVNDTTLWTEWTLNWWAMQCAPGCFVDARKRRTKPQRARAQNYTPQDWNSFYGDQVQCKKRETTGEFVLDLVHTTIPGGGRGCHVNRRIETTLPAESLDSRTMRLALESEVGSNGERAETIAKTFEDAMKVLVVHAAIKVMVFSTFEENQQELPLRKVILDYAARLVRADESAFTAWIWIDSPWDDLQPFARVYSKEGDEVTHVDCHGRNRRGRRRANV